MFYYRISIMILQEIISFNILSNEWKKKQNKTKQNHGLHVPEKFHQRLLRLKAQIVYSTT